LMPNLNPVGHHSTKLKVPRVLRAWTALLQSWGTTTDSVIGFEPNNQMVNCDPRKGKYMAVALLYKGDGYNITLIE
jgi:hypothetical protein